MSGEAMEISFYERECYSQQKHGLNEKIIKIL